MEICKQLASHSYNPASLEVPVKGVIHNYRDPVIPCLRIRISATNRAWIFYKQVGGKQFKRHLGSLDELSLTEARIRASEMGRDLERGNVPDKKREKVFKFNVTTVGEIFLMYFLEHVSVRCRTAAEIKRGFDKYWGPIKDVQATKLDARQVRAWINEMFKTNGAATANKQITTIRAAFKHAQIGNALRLETDPLLGISKFPENKRSNYLKAGDDLKKIMESMEHESQDVQDICNIGIYTAQRKSNVLQMEWREVDLVNHKWCIPARKTKTNTNYIVRLTPQAEEILARRFAEKRCDYVFPSESPGSTKLYRASIQHAWQRICERAGMDDFHFHDLRHTTPTWMAINGASAFEIKEALQHANVSMSQRYVDMANADVRSVMSNAQAKAMVAHVD